MEDFISLYEYVKELLKYVGADIISKEELDELDDQAIVDVILGMEETYGVKQNEFKPIGEIKKYLKQAVDEFLEKSQQVASEHNYSKPRSKMHNLRKRTSNMYNRDCSCCNSR